MNEISSTSSSVGIQVIVPQPTMLTREFEAELTEGDGRTLDLRVVPYNTVARVADPPDYTPYDETWLPGAFDNQLKAANRVSVFLNFEHEQGLRGIVGHGVELQDTPDGLHGSFRVHQNQDGEKALDLVREGLLTGVSLEAKALKSQKRNGITERVRAHLEAVALTRTGRAAYKEAQVLAVRTTPEIEKPPVMPDELMERLERLGVEVLTRIAISRKPWDGSAARFTDEEYQASCLIDRGGDAPAKERCSLPVLEPDGALNVNALGAAAARLNQVQGVSAEMRSAAARKLRRYYGQAGVQPPASLMGMAAR